MVEEASEGGINFLGTFPEPNTGLGSEESRVRNRTQSVLLGNRDHRGEETDGLEYYHVTSLWTESGGWGPGGGVLGPARNSAGSFHQSQEESL